MSRVWRLLADDCVGAAEGLALDEALMAGYSHESADRPPTLRLYSYRDHCALIGRYQNLEAEVDLAACRRTGTQVSRRLTGGGAIVMGSGQLGIAYVDRAPADYRPREMLAELATALVAGLTELGIAASFRGKNDVEVAGRKIAGLGLYVDGAGAMLFHASVLADLDVAFMLEVLRIPAAKLADRATAAVAERLTTVSTETACRHDARTLRSAIGKGFELSFGTKLKPGRPDGQERARTKALVTSRYGAEAWLNERSIVGDASGSAMLKTPAGLARIYLTSHGDLVKSVMVAGDFNELPPALVAMESDLRWQRLDRESVAAVVSRSGAADALGVAPEQLADLVMEAGRLSAGHFMAAPVPTGPIGLAVEANVADLRQGSEPS